MVWNSSSNSKLRQLIPSLIMKLWSKFEVDSTDRSEDISIFGFYRPVCKIPSRIPKYINISESKRTFHCNL